MKRLIIAAAGALALATGGIVSASGPAKAATAHSQTVTFAIANMTCPTCPITVKAAMRRVAGVQSVSISLERKTATVVFDPSRVKATMIAAASTGVGYPATIVR